jgi:hypothetical protein
MGENHFIATNFDTLPTVEKLSIYHEIFGTSLFLWQKTLHQISRPKDSPKKCYLLVAAVDSFSLRPTLTASQRLIYYFFAMKFLGKKPFFNTIL